MDGLDYWFNRPTPKRADEKTRLERQIAIIRRVRKRLVNQRWALHTLERAYTSELKRSDELQATIDRLRSQNIDMACKLFDAENRFDEGWFARLLRWFRS